MQSVSPAAFLLTYLILAVSAAGQLSIQNIYTGAIRLPAGYIAGMGAYIAAIALLLVLYINWERFNSYGKPLSALGVAVNRVANGDFSVRLNFARGNKESASFIGTVYDDFNKMVEELGSIETLKDDFISNVSHEIKTPLAIVQNYSSIKCDKYDIDTFPRTDRGVTTTRQQNNIPDERSVSPF
jgi:methyl-accepting chemotaxis protein